MFGRPETTLQLHDSWWKDLRSVTQFFGIGGILQKQKVSHAIQCEENFTTMICKANTNIPATCISGTAHFFNYIGQHLNELLQLGIGLYNI